jgi:hypothetical protein
MAGCSLTEKPAIFEQAAFSGKLRLPAQPFSDGGNLGTPKPPVKLPQVAYCFVLF